MGAARFYHLTQRSLDATLRMLLEKSLGAGWRVVVRGTDPEGLAALDQALWMGDQASFLPHGMAGGAQDADQPILLGTDAQNRNGAQCIMAVHSAEVTPQEVASFERVCILFDGFDQEALSHARLQWKTLTDAGVSAQYWSEESGRWEMKAEAGA